LHILSFLNFSSLDGGSNSFHFIKIERSPISLFAAKNGGEYQSSELSDLCLKEAERDWIIISVLKQQRDKTKLEVMYLKL